MRPHGLLCGWLSIYPPVDAAGHYLLTRISRNGLMSAAGFYSESPTRNQWDGVAECYSIYSFRQLAILFKAPEQQNGAAEWNRHSETLQRRFHEIFWQRDHFAEYLQPEHGLVDSHGLSDVNWAAIGFEVATEE